MHGIMGLLFLERCQYPKKSGPKNLADHHFGRLDLLISDRLGLENLLPVAVVVLASAIVIDSDKFGAFADNIGELELGITSSLWAYSS